MKFEEFAKKALVYKKFPVGETLIDFADASVEESSIETSDGKKKVYLLKVGNEVYYCPSSVLTQAAKYCLEGITKLKVVRSGLGKNDTRYVVVPTQS